MIKKIYTRLALVVVFALAFASCDTTSEELESSLACFDIVTFVGQTSEGSVFSFQEEEDLPVITLTSTKQVTDSDIKIGDRVLLAYYPNSGVQYVSGPITTIYCKPIISGNITVGKAQHYDNWQSESVLMQALWRSGEYVNLQCLVPVQEGPGRFDLIIDDDTIDDEYPQAYLVFKTDSESSTKTKTVYGSFNISSVWAKTSSKGIIINFSNYIGQNSVSLSK